MSRGRPASLDGSLLARKGDAAPAIPPNSPLTEELGEPRPEPVALSLSSKAAAATPTGWLQGPGARERIVWILLLSFLAAALIFAATRLLPTTAIVVGQTPSGTEFARDESQPQSVAMAERPSEGPTIRPVTATAAATPAIEDGASGTSQTKDLPDAAPDRPAGEVQVAKNTPLVAIVPLPAKPKPAVRSGRYLLQLASLPSAGEAKRELNRLQDRLSRVLGERKIAVVRAVPKGKNPVYRLRASAYQTRNSARAACDRIKKLKIGCLVVRR